MVYGTYSDMPKRPGPISAAPGADKRPRDLITLALAVAALGCLVYIPRFGTMAALGFLLSGTLLGMRAPERAFGMCMRYWYVLLLPVYCTISTLWSAFPGISMRLGIQLTASFVIAILIATMLKPREFRMAMLAFLSLAMALSILVGEVRSDTGAWLGIYGSKNAFAGASSTFTLFALALALDREARSTVRLGACAGVCLGILLCVLSASVGAIVVLPVALMLMLVLPALPGTDPLKLVTMAIGAALAAALIGLVVWASLDAIFDWMLATTDKDPTLTGRTDLWRVAVALISERPLFGLGYQAFWVQGVAEAEELWAQFGIEARSGFNFHNLYLSNAVEIGIVGVALQSLLLFGAAFLCLRWFFQAPNADANLLFTLVATTIIWTPLEVSIYFQFSLRTTLIICAFVFAAEQLRARRQHVSQPRA